MVSIRGNSPKEKFDFCNLHLKRYLDDPDDTLEDRIRKTSVEDARTMLELWRNFFRNLLRLNGYSDQQIRGLTQKFFDAGRRSPPWQPGSESGFRRPQDGADGNRQSRWLFEENHKFYATEKIATLCEIRYYPQTLSMDGAPEIPDAAFEIGFASLLGHSLKPGEFVDPIQRIPIQFQQFIGDPRYMESGHIIPLGRGGRHTPDNATLMLRESNRLQADLTLEELLEVMAGILSRHGFDVSKLA